MYLHVCVIYTDTSKRVKSLLTSIVSEIADLKDDLSHIRKIVDRIADSSKRRSSTFYVSSDISDEEDEADDDSYLPESDGSSVELPRAERPARSSRKPQVYREVSSSEEEDEDELERTRPRKMVRTKEIIEISSSDDDELEDEEDNEMEEHESPSAKEDASYSD